jgi:hypothetical protein
MPACPMKSQPAHGERADIMLQLCWVVSEGQARQSLELSPVSASLCTCVYTSPYVSSSGPLSAGTDHFGCPNRLC